jgi:2-C-methyl-D-erythritol 2,4-cyclodiphosphate synthase
MSGGLDSLRVGIGFDAHAFAGGRPLVLAGVTIPHERGLEGHSDADLVSHAVTDAVLGAAGMEDIGHLFPSDDPALRGAASIELLRQAWARVAAAGWALVNVDAIVIVQVPRIAPHREAMRGALADALSAEPFRVTVRASTTDHLGFTGRGEGAACQAVALLRRTA